MGSNYQKLVFVIIKLFLIYNILSSGSVIQSIIGDPLVNKITDNQSTPPKSTQNVSNYTSHAPIYIDSTSHKEPGFNGITRGSGQEDDPFVIEGWAISDDSENPQYYHGISLYQVEEHFLITNCSLSGFNYADWSHAIEVSGTSNVNITMCQIADSANGIAVFSCIADEEILISQNLMVEIHEVGVILEFHRNLGWSNYGITVSHNDIHSSGHHNPNGDFYGNGINFINGSNCLITENSISQFDRYGLMIWSENVTNSEITNNAFCGNNEGGIRIFGDNDVNLVISNNQCGDISRYVENSIAGYSYISMIYIVIFCTTILILRSKNKK